MILRRILAAVVLLWAFPCLAQTGSVKTPSQLNAEINTTFPNNTVGQITPAGLRQVTLDQVASVPFLNVTNVFGASQAFPNGVTISGGTITGAAISGGTITGLPTPVNPSDAVTLSYVNAAVTTGINILAPSRLATAAVLPNTPTYANGTAGVGATLTAGSNSTLTVDGTVANLNDIVLVKNQGSAFQNGIYTLTTVGSGSAAWVLTRVSYFNIASQMKVGSYTFITAGTANANASYTLQSTVVTVGTDALTWALFSSTGTAVTSLDGTNGNISVASGSLKVVSGQLSSNVLSSRAFAITQDLSSFTSIHLLGYYTGSDGGRADFVKVGSQPFCGPYADTAAFQDAGGNWWNIAEPIEYNIKQFGAKMDSIVGLSGTDDTAAVLSAVRCAGVQTGAGDDIGGGAGKIVRIPAGWSLISSTIIVPNQVPVIGICPICNGFDMASGFATNAHFFILGDQFTAQDVCQTQTIGAAGNLILNGSLTRSGVATPLYPVQPQINAVGNNAGINFTFTGTDRYGNSQNETIAGPNAGTVGSSKFWKTITQVATSAATVGSVSIGFPQIATFGTRLQDLQLFSSNLNAVNFVTTINESGITGHSGNGMVYTNSAQHTAGVKNVKVFAGDRMAFFFEVGVGGAAIVTLQDIESFNAGNCGGCAVNNPQAYFNYAGLAFPVVNYVIGGPGAAGGSSTAVIIDGGYVDWSGGHCEGVSICVLMDVANINNGNLTIKNLVGASSVTDLLKINTGSPASITYAQGLWGNGSTRTVNNQGTPITGNVIPWTLY